MYAETSSTGLKCQKKLVSNLYKLQNVAQRFPGGAELLDFRLDHLYSFSVPSDFRAGYAVFNQHDICQAVDHTEPREK